MKARIIEIANKRITSIWQLKGDYNRNDGLGMSQNGVIYDVHDCIIDLSDVDLSDQDEAVAVTWGASANFKRCWIKGAGKLILCGSGDENKRFVEEGKTVYFYDCLIEDFGRRGPEVQAGMYVVLQDCVIRNWGDPTRFSDRNFGAWAHHGGSIDAMNCVFWQDKFLRPLKQMIWDFKNHWWQALIDSKGLSIFKPSTYRPGVCRGLTASDGGSVVCWQCWANHWWIKLEEANDRLSDEKAKELLYRVEARMKLLDTELPKS